MKTMLKSLTLLAASALLAPGVAAEPREADAQEQTEKRTDLVDCRDYRGALKRVGDKCVRPMGVTRVYTREDLLGTGQFDTGAALRRLDPSIH